MGNHIVKLNYMCNASCSFCADARTIRTLKDPDFDELITSLRNARKDYSSLIISGGEPTICANLPAYLDEAIKLGYKEILISTNGLRLQYADFTQSLVNKGVNKFQIAFQTVDRDVYDKITGIKNSLEIVSQGMKNIEESGAKIVINTVIHKLNYEKMEEITKHLMKLGVENIQLSFMNPVGDSVVDGKSTMAISMTEAVPFILKAIDAADKIGFKNLFIENIPLCVLDNKDRISDLRKENKDYYNQSKIKPDKCRKCIHDNVCDGVWADYLNQFGEDELVVQ